MLTTIVRQFGKPSGLLGEVAGLIMTFRPSNRERNERTLELLDIQPNDHVLEVGFGPGLGIERAAMIVRAGKVVGVDHSELMLRQASRRNAVAIAAGKVCLLLGSAEHLPDFGFRFDKVFAINVYMFWKEPVAVLRAIGSAMKPGGTVALTFQPRRRGATSKDTQMGAERMALSLRAAGFEEVRINTLEMDPVDAACVVGKLPE
jgi:ubiquinone/menaquinone biosynthesis C-methylase UbiE